MQISLKLSFGLQLVVSFSLHCRKWITTVNIKKCKILEFLSVGSRQEPLRIKIFLGNEPGSHQHPPWNIHNKR